MDSKKVVKIKAKAGYDVISAPVLVEDTSVVFKALGKLPGPFIKWFLDELGNEGLCSLLDKYPTRDATAIVLYCLYDGENYHLFEGVTEGRIAKKPKGEEDFGWNPIFIPNGQNKTWAEMDSKEREITSARYKATKKLKNYVKTL